MEFESLHQTCKVWSCGWWYTDYYQCPFHSSNCSISFFNVSAPLFTTLMDNPHAWFVIYIRYTCKSVNLYLFIPNTEKSFLQSYSSIYIFKKLKYPGSPPKSGGRVAAWGGRSSGNDACGILSPLLADSSTLSSQTCTSFSAVQVHGVPVQNRRLMEGSGMQCCHRHSSQKCPLSLPKHPNSPPPLDRTHSFWAWLQWEEEGEGWTLIASQIFMTKDRDPNIMSKYWFLPFTLIVRGGGKPDMPR